ncbi:F-box/LRR-repeat protein At3g59190-like [Durio zibethinus]|uniref:F-box/LRR-repeat protein At3g59190-like n=1 Tax=Durio zibethinus TaxID=66656 RepID=A0A6P5WNH5_DURZI|nr:F-box/LRR-repeat protein At3g59190-like [Durio zibethinus]
MKDEDRISNLPDTILCHILSFLSTKEVVGSAILSTRWRYLFASVSNLEVLFFYNTSTSMDKFRLRCCQAVDSSNVYGWISAAPWRGVQHLDLTISFGKDKFMATLPGVMFNCVTLVTLKLDIDFVLEVSKHLKDFSPAALVLKIWSWRNRSTILHSNFNGLITNYRIVIDAPSLVYFKCTDNVAAGYSLENMQSVVHADIDFCSTWR